MSIEMDECRAFVVLAQELHFRRASGQLFLSQPALSKKIRRLEDKVKGPLFARTRRKVSLTEAGRVLLPRARKLLLESESAFAATRAAFEGKSGTLRIGFGIASVSEILPRTILRFRASYPQAELQMRDMSTPSQICALLEGNLDVGILRWPVAHPELTGGSLFRESLVLAAPSTMRFQSGEGLSAFRDKAFILLPRSTSETFHDHTLNLCRRSGFSPQVVQEASEIFTILNLVRAGLGVALVPSSAVRMRVPGVRLHRLRTKEASWSIGVVWNRNTEKGELVQRWVQMIRGVVQGRKITDYITRSVRGRVSG